VGSEEGSLPASDLGLAQPLQKTENKLLEPLKDVAKKLKLAASLTL
jgi:hypothetical protein